MRKSISYLEKTSRLCNPEANNTSEKKISGSHNPELILCIKKTSGLCNPEANHKRLPDYIIRKLILNLKKDFRIM